MRRDVLNGQFQQFSTFDMGNWNGQVKIIIVVNSNSTLTITTCNFSGDSKRNLMKSTRYLASIKGLQFTPRETTYSRYCATDTDKCVYTFLDSMYVHRSVILKYQELAFIINAAYRKHTWYKNRIAILPFIFAYDLPTLALLFLLPQ